MLTEQLSIFELPADFGGIVLVDSPVRKANPLHKAVRQAAAPANGAKTADKFEAMADLMQVQIEAKMADRQTNTCKRLGQAMSARAESERLIRTQQALRALAGLHRAGDVPPILASIKSKKDVHELVRAEMQQVPNGFHTYYADAGRPPKDAGEQSLAVWALLSGKTDEEKHADALRQKIEGLQFSKIPGYFPTPPAVVELMLDHANIGPVDVVCEPSAGSGAIIDGIIERHGDTPIIVVYEINATLCEILRLKGFDARPLDFLASDCRPSYDRIVMNPPFENQQDVKHVLHAYSRLKPGGRLVSVMSASPFFRSNKESVAFRQWLEKIGGEVVNLPENSFKDSGTGVNTKLVIINKE